MKPHIKNYYDHFGYEYIDQYIQCEVDGCGQPSTDIHHLIPRSKFGKKRKAEQDHISNLIALCRDCHTAAHDNKSFNQALIYKVKQRG